MADEFISGQSTARKAAAILAAKNAGFWVPTARQKQNLAVALAKRGMVVEKHLSKITIFEIKSTRKKLKPDFSKYFFALTAAEVLVAQSLKKNFRFVFVNTTTGDFLELDLVGIFARARGIYPTWSISF
jgi:hypothetical protein